MAGAVVHFEIPADDPERAQDFYREAFGWGVDPMPDSPTRCCGRCRSTGRAARSRPVRSTAACSSVRASGRRRVVVIDVEDIPATLAEVQRLGGATVREMTPVGEMGFAAYFTDTEGNLMGLWQSAPG